MSDSPLKSRSDKVCRLVYVVHTETRCLETQHLAGSTPHKWGGHITHQMCCSTFDAGNLQVRFDEGRVSRTTVLLSLLLYWPKWFCAARSSKLLSVRLGP